MDLCFEAALHGDTLELSRLRDSGQPWDEYTCAAAAAGGYLETLQWAHEHGCPWDARTCSMAAWKRHLNILRWARANGCPWNRDACLRAATDSDTITWISSCPDNVVTKSAAPRRAAPNLCQ